MRYLIRIVFFIFLVGLFFSCNSNRPFSKRDMNKKKDYYNMHELDQKKRDKVLIKNMKKKKRKNKKN